MNDENRPLSPDEAAELWSRAAELQEAARRQTERALEGDPDRSGRDVPGDPSSVTRAIARQAAIESGIDARFVDTASLTIEVESHLDRSRSRGRAGRALGFTEERLNERAIVSTGLAAARAALGEVTGSELFESEPVEIVEHGPASVAFVYEVPANLKSMFNEGSFHYTVRSVSEVRRYAVLLTELENGTTEITVYCTLDKSLSINAIAMRVFQGVAGAAGAVGGGFLGSFLVGLAGLAGTAMSTVAVGVVSAGLGIGVAALVGMGFRAAYRRAHEKLRGAFRKLLTAVRMRVSG